MYWFPQLLGRSFQKVRNFTASSHQTAGFSIVSFQKFSGGDAPRTLTTGGGDPLPHPLGASAPVLGPKPWSSSTFQPWLRPCLHMTLTS